MGARALILYCASASDVARGLEFAQQRNLPLAVRGGGHNRAGFSACDNGLVIDLSRMNRVDVDARKRLARAQAGALVVHLAGVLVYPSGRVPDLLQAFGKFVAAAPDEMNVVGQVSQSPQGPRFQMLLCHCGDPRRGNDLLRPLRALDPEKDSVGVASYLQTNATVNPAAPVAHFQTNLFLPNLSATAIETITTAASNAPPNARVFIVPFYGAVTRVGFNDTAFALRYFGYELDIMGRWDDPVDKPRAVQWVKALRDELQPLARGTYVNQLGETSEELVRAAYGTHFSRLAAIKKKYDPTNALRLNQNIQPT